MNETEGPSEHHGKCQHWGAGEQQPRAWLSPVTIISCVVPQTQDWWAPHPAPRAPLLRSGPDLNLVLEPPESFLLPVLFSY